MLKTFHPPKPKLFGTCVSPFFFFLRDGAATPGASARRCLFGLFAVLCAHSTLQTHSNHHHLLSGECSQYLNRTEWSTSSRQPIENHTAGRPGHATPIPWASCGLPSSSLLLRAQVVSKNHTGLASRRSIDLLQFQQVELKGSDALLLSSQYSAEAIQARHWRQRQRQRGRRRQVRRRSCSSPASAWLLASVPSVFMLSVSSGFRESTLWWG